MTRAIHSDLLPRLTALCGLALVCSILAYGTLILLMVKETAYRARAEQGIRSLTSEMGSLERQYLAAEETVTLAEAESRGFAEAKTIARVVRQNPISALSFRNEPR